LRLWHSLSKKKLFSPVKKQERDFSKIRCITAQTTSPNTFLRSLFFISGQQDSLSLVYF
jgi:hypothetical protein